MSLLPTSRRFHGWLSTCDSLSLLFPFPNYGPGTSVLDIILHCLHLSCFGNLIYSRSFQSSPLFRITYPKVHWIPSLGSLTVFSRAMYPTLYSPFIYKDFYFLVLPFSQPSKFKTTVLLTSSFTTHTSTYNLCSYQFLL